MEDKEVKTGEEFHHAEGENSHETQANKRDPFALFGKITAAVIIIILLLGGGIYLGQTMNNKSSSNQSAQTNQISPTQVMQASPSPAPTANLPIIATKPVTAGGASGTSFTTYTVQVPSDWTATPENTSISDKLTLTKGPLSISIYQAPMGGGGCIYPGDPPAQMAQSFTDYVAIKGVQAQFRRSFNKSNDPTITYTICQAGSDGYGSPTSFGAISVTAPSSASQTSLAEADSIIASLKK